MSWMLLSDMGLSRGFILTSPSRVWCRRSGGQLKTGTSELKENLEPGSRIFDYARWRREWVTMSGHIAHEHQVWAALIMDVANSIGEHRH